jgi:hypothetical protein
MELKGTRMNHRRLSLGEKVKGFLGTPVNTFNNIEAEALGSALKYFTIWLVIYTILRTVVFYTLEKRVFQTLWDLLGLSDAAPYLYYFDPVIFALLAVVGAFASLFISGSWAHLFVRAFGGRKGYGNTIKAFAYGNTPLFLFGWIPFVGTLFSLWALVLNIIGIRQLHEISTGRAIGAVLLGIVTLIIIIFLIVLFVVLFVVIQAVA